MPDTLDLTINVAGIEAALEKFTQFGTEAGKRFWGAFGNGPGGSGGGAGGTGGHGHGYGPGGWRSQGGGGRMTDAQKQAQSEEMAHRRSLQYMVQSGRRQQREDARRERSEERAATAQKRRDEKEASRDKARRDKEIWDAAGRLEKSREQQRSYYDRAAAVGGRAASRIATAGVGIGTGLVAAGFHGTTTGSHFANETRLLSLEMASLFDPFMKSLTVAMQKIRQRMSTMTRAEQDTAATRLALIAGARATGLDTALVSGASSMVGGAIGRYGISGSAGMLVGGVARAAPPVAIGAAAYATGKHIVEAGSSSEALINSWNMETHPGMGAELGMHRYANLQGDRLKNQIEKDEAALARRRAVIATHYQNRSSFGRGTSDLAFWNNTPGQSQLNREEADINRRAAYLNERRKKGMDTSFNGTHLTDVSTAGVGGLGSTSEMIQNQVAKLNDGKKAKEDDPIVVWLTRIFYAILGVKNPDDDDGSDSNIAPAPKG